MRGRAWGPRDRNGGAIDEVFDAIRAQVPSLVVERLEVTHPADDDNVYFLGPAPSDLFVQVDTNPNGQPPFFVEADDRFETSELSKASATIIDWLRSWGGARR